MADKQVLMQLVNMLAGQGQAIGQQRMQRSQMRAGMEQDRARMGMQAKQFEAKHKLQMEDSKRNQKIFDMQMEQFDVAQQDRENKLKLGEALGEIAGASGELNWTSFESIMEDPGVQEAGLIPLLQQFPDVATPYMTEKREIPLESMIHLGIGYDALPADWQAAIPQETWARGIADYQKVKDRGDEGAELANIMLKAQIKDYEQRYAGEGIYAAGYGRSGGGGGGTPLDEDPPPPDMDVEEQKAAMRSYLVEPVGGWRTESLMNNIRALEELEAAYGDNKEMVIFALNSKRQLQDILDGLTKKKEPAPSGAGPSIIEGVHPKTII